MFSTRSIGIGSLVILAVLVVVGLAWWWASLDRSAAAFVEKSGTQFTLNGEPFRFVGVNLYNAAGDPTIYSCGPWLENPDSQLADWFHRVKAGTGATVVRFWAFQSYTAGGTDWRALDRVMSVAAREGIKVIPVLENEWAVCTGGATKDAAWFGGGYTRPDGDPLSYRDYVRKIVERYRDNPAIFGWMLMNEAESSAADPRTGAEALYSFTRDMSAYVHALDTNHLVTLGVAGGPDKPGASGADYGALHALPTIDFLSYHDYRQDDAALPGLPVDLASPLIATIFTQDATWSWIDDGYTQLKSQAWQTLTATIPQGVGPYQRVGLNFVSQFTGDIYVDRVQIGAHAYDFQDGGTNHWETFAPFTLDNLSGVGMDGERALRVSVTPTTGTQIWMPLPEEVEPGTPITLHVYADGPGTTNLADSLAAALRDEQSLDKPLVVDESGMLTCQTQEGRVLESPASRGEKLDAKLNAFFASGGSGYLVWTWDPTSDCDYNFTTGDPLEAVLARHAASLRSNRADDF